MAPPKKNMESMEFAELPSKTNETKLQAQHRAILSKAVDNYLSWRTNKSFPDNRGYHNSIFTWLRHYTAFGENRAKDLKSAFFSMTEADPIELLQKHLQKNSRLNNHSLDTYLLESIVSNKELFCLGNKFTSLNTFSARTALHKYLLGAEFSALHFFTVAKNYEQENNEAAALVFYEKAAGFSNIDAAIFLGQYLDLNGPTNKHKAFDYYLIAAKQGSYDALAPLERLGEEEASAKDQLELSNVYATFFHDPERAEYWLAKSKEVEQFTFKI